MAFCTSCGAYTADGSRFCPACGKPAGEHQETTARENTASGSGPADNNTTYQNVYRTYNVTADTSGDRYLCLLCYFGLLLLIPFLILPNSQFAKYHCNQGLLLLLTAIASSVVVIIPILGWIAAFVGWIFTVICFVVGIVNVFSSRMHPLPIVGRYTLIK